MQALVKADQRRLLLPAVSCDAAAGARAAATARQPAVVAASVEGVDAERDKPVARATAGTARGVSRAALIVGERSARP